MNITEAIDYDLECVREYCKRLIAFANASSRDFIPPKAKSTRGTQYLPIDVSHLVRPDLISNIYALVDFRLKTLCDHHHKSGKAASSFQEFKRSDKGKTSDLARYKKYLQSEASIDFAPFQDSFKHLDLMRRIRNTYMHHGGHADEDTSRVVAGVHGVTTSASLLVVSDEYISESIDHAAKLLLSIANA